MQPRRFATILALAGAVAGAASCSDRNDDASPADAAAGLPEALAALGPAPTFAPAPHDPALLERAARGAWAYFEAHPPATTGLVPATEGWESVTVWDLGSTLAAYHAAHELGYLDDAGFEARTRRLLETLGELPLYDSTALYRAYGTADGRPSGADGGDADASAGWSALDLGRLLVGLHLVRAHHPALGPLAERVVARMDLGRVVHDGRLWGEAIGDDGKPVQYGEGKLGYEQYAARGFALWGHEAAEALDVAAHAAAAEAEGVPLLRDDRGGERLTSDPFVLLGLELGWTPGEERLALAVLEAQRARWRNTGQITIVGEDAIDRPPHYFYYYAVMDDGRPFGVGAHASMEGVDPPRWVSAKGALGWYALLPTEYTRAAADAVLPAMGERGWGPGVYEGTGASAGGPNLNTAAVILEAALFARTGTPLAMGSAR